MCHKLQADKNIYFPVFSIWFKIISIYMSLRTHIMNICMQPFEFSKIRIGIFHILYFLRVGKYGFNFSIINSRTNPFHLFGFNEVGLNKAFGSFNLVLLYRIFCICFLSRYMFQIKYNITTENHET